MADDPIRLYYWPTPNGWKVSIMLEETGLPYSVVPVDITAGDQFDPGFLGVSPNNKIPALVDPNGPDGELSLFESGAMLLYLAERSGRFLPREGQSHWQTVQWLMFQMGGFGPMLGQLHHFRNYAPERIDYALERYGNEASRLYGVLDRQLAEQEYVAGPEYTVADIAVWPWIKPHEEQGMDLAAFPNVQRWFRIVEARPAVQRGVALLAEERDRNREGGTFNEQAREILFGAAQYRRW